MERQVGFSCDFILNQNSLGSNSILLCFFLTGCFLRKLVEGKGTRSNVEINKQLPISWEKNSKPKDNNKE